MAINPNPVANQMQAFGNTDEAKVTATTTPAPSFLQTPATQTPAKITAPAGLSTAQQILQKEGVSSSRELLDSMRVPSAKDILAGSGITSAQEILEKEGLKVQRQKKFQEEMDLREKEKEFIKNYKFDANTFNPTAYETKYGNLDFKDAKLEYDFGWSDENNYYSYNFDIDGTKYVFMPEEVAMRGLKGADNKQRFNFAFLDKETWKALTETSQAMDLSNMDMSSLQTVNPTQDPRRQFNANDTNKVQGRGFLFSKEDFEKFRTEHLDDSWRAWGSSDPAYGTGKNKYGGDIKGLSQLPSGELIYVTQPIGGHDQVSTYINSKGVAWKHWYDKPRGGGIVGDIVRGVGKIFNDVPLLPEIIVLATGGAAAPYYPAMKGSQVVAAGGDLGDVLTTMGTAYIATSPVMQNATASLSSTFADAGLTATAANVAAGAVVNAGFAGTVAALTGQDIGKAVTAGALSGGFQAGTPAIADALFGDSATVGSLANSVGLSKAQFQNITVSAMGNAAIGAAVYGRDFTEMFTQSLVVNGLSQSAANKVGASMKGKDSADIQKAVQATRLVVQATARSAIRGTDINMELERALTSFTEKQVLSTARDVGQKK